MSDLKINMPALTPPSADFSRSRDATKGTGESADVSFTSLVKQSVDAVNGQQSEAAKLAESFERGEESVDLVRVMVEMQKARVSFEAVSQVRNKLVEAYREVMNMQV